jgi:hypothetical protein
MILVTGVDPGLVDTGIVHFSFYPESKEIKVAPTTDLRELVYRNQKRKYFIEGYRPRAHMSTDKDMVELVAHIRQMCKGTVLDNTGVKKIVGQPLMELLGVWLFKQTTHHQDLRSAARIAILGMLKDEEMNELIADIVRDHLEGKPWHVVVLD